MNHKNAFLNTLVVFSIILSSIGFAFIPDGIAEAASALHEQIDADAVLQSNPLAVYADLSGNVYQADSSTPIADAQVEAIHVDSGTVEYTSTNSSGYYVFSIAPGDYYVSVFASGYGKEYYENTYDLFYATIVTVNESTGASGIDFTLSPEAAVTGYVYESDGVTPIPGANVSLDPVSGGQGFYTVSGADGSYTINGLSSGSYNAYASADGYYGEYYLNQISWGLADVVSVTQPNITTGINFTLAEAYSLSGYVFQEDGVTPIDGAWVSILNNEFQYVDYEITDIYGYYELLLPPGQYYVYFEAYGYGSLYYQNGYDHLGAALVTVEAGTGASGIDISLSPEATISGYVYESDGVTPIIDACVEKPIRKMVEKCIKHGLDLMVPIP